MNQTIVIDTMADADWNQVREIYEEGIQSGNATFETEAPTWKAWDEKYLTDCRLVVREGNQIIGWAAIFPTSNRKAFKGVVELSIYLRSTASGNGIGTKLLQTLIEKSEEEGYWTLQAGIFPENEPSIRLHEKLGFQTVGIRKQLGKLHGVWRDVVLMERRSRVVGIE